jgi:hypothetical protein
MSQPAVAIGQAHPARARQRKQGLSFLLHAPAKAGKSSLADSGPAPRLIMDIEGTSWLTPSRKAYWDPMREPPPQQERHLTAGYGQPSVTVAWESCIVLIRAAREIDRVYQVLNSGRHPFNALSVDSVTEMQQRVIDELSPGTGKVDRDQWGILLRKINSMVRAYRDLLTHPSRPLWSVVFVAGTTEHNGKWRPMVQGQARDSLPYYVDILGYLHANADNTRDLLIGPHPSFETGERVGGRLPYSLRIGYPGRVQGWTIEDMLKQVLKEG